MNWGGWAEFFYMKGYALYIWGSYGVTAMLIVAEIFSLRARRQRAIQLALRTVKYGKVEKDEGNDEVTA
ncbi:MAG: heme exporter protein CcmD [Sulfuricella denitrificans]|nr:heme exporter protein CcmD [Sulfuricella denitrificans]